MSDLPVRIYELEFSRSPDGVAMFAHQVDPAMPVEYTLEPALQFVAKAASDHHGEQMMPSLDPDDYVVREAGGSRLPRTMFRVYLRDDHEWWDGPVAARVARRNHMPPHWWRTTNRVASELGQRADRVTVPTRPVEGPDGTWAYEMEVTR
jgi:hypothetical protein